jgi:hypothetical protein
MAGVGKFAALPNTGRCACKGFLNLHPLRTQDAGLSVSATLMGWK